MSCVGLGVCRTSPDPPPRESVELRSYCFWEDLPPQDAAMQLLSAHPIHTIYAINFMDTEMNGLDSLQTVSSCQ